METTANPRPIETSLSIVPVKRDKWADFGEWL